MKNDKLLNFSAVEGKTRSKMCFKTPVSAEDIVPTLVGLQAAQVLNVCVRWEELCRRDGSRRMSTGQLAKDTEEAIMAKHTGWANKSRRSKRVFRRRALLCYDRKSSTRFLKLQSPSDTSLKHELAFAKFPLCLWMHKNTKSEIKTLR